MFFDISGGFFVCSLFAYHSLTTSHVQPSAKTPPAIYVFGHKWLFFLTSKLWAQSAVLQTAALCSLCPLAANLIRVFHASEQQISKNAISSRKVHFFCIFLEILTSFSSLPYYLCSRFRKYTFPNIAPKYV